MVEWLSSIEDKNLNGCGKLVLTGDMSELSITKVDLSNMNTLEGKLCCLRATLMATPEAGRMPNRLRGAHATPSLFPSGDIAALQNMPLEKLDLYCCWQLTGKSACAWGGSVKCCQGNT